MININNIDDVFALVDSMFRNPIDSLNYTVNGLKSLFPRPHNLYVERNKNGDIQKYIIKTVYTPWTKKDISVKFKDDRHGTRLIITVGITNSNLESETTEISTISKVESNSDKICQYHGISSKPYSIEFPLPENIDAKTINVSADEGLLKIEIPVVHTNETEFSLNIN